MEANTSWGVNLLAPPRLSLVPSADLQLLKETVVMWRSGEGVIESCGEPRKSTLQEVSVALQTSVEDFSGLEVALAAVKVSEFSLLLQVCLDVYYGTRSTGLL